MGHGRCGYGAVCKGGSEVAASIAATGVQLTGRLTSFQPRLNGTWHTMSCGIVVHRTHPTSIWTQGHRKCPYKRHVSFAASVPVPDMLNVRAAIDSINNRSVALFLVDEWIVLFL